MQAQGRSLVAACIKVCTGASHHSDGTHLNAAGMEAFAKALAEGPLKDHRSDCRTRTLEALDQDLKPDLVVSDSTLCAVWTEARACRSFEAHHL